MDKLGNVLMNLMWLVVVLAIIIFVVVIIVGHTNSFDFFYGLEDNSVISTSANYLTSKLS